MTSTNFTFNYPNYPVPTSFLCDSCSCKAVCKYIDNAKRMNDELEKMNKDGYPIKATISCEHYTASIYTYTPQESISKYITLNQSTIDTESQNGTEINSNENMPTSISREPLYEEV